MDNKIPDTPRIIEKFTNEEGEVDVNKMASKMSSINEQNFTYKRIILFSSVFLVVAIGLMISANVLGTYVLKDTKVKNGQLVSYKDGTPVQMGASLYKVPVYLFSSTEVLDGLKYLEIPTLLDGVSSLLHMEVDSYINQAGKKIVFIGKKYCVVMNRHNYEVFLNDDNFDPLLLANSTTSTDTSSTTSTNVSGENDDSTEQSEAAKRSIFNSEGFGHIKKRVHSTVEGHKKRHIQGEHGEDDIMQEFAMLNGTGNTPAAATSRASIINLTYHGGSMVTNGTVVPIVWYDTTNGNFNAANLQTCYKNMPVFMNDLLRTKLFTQLTPGKKGSDPQCKVNGIDSNVHYLVPDASRKKQTLSDSDISKQLISWLTVAYDANKPNATIPKNAANPLQYMYMIFFPSGIKLSSGFCSSYCGFHSYYNSYNYAVLPWVGDCMGSCGMSSYVSTFGGSTCGSLQSVVAHEMTEMATDPYFYAYYDSQGNESADKCAWTSPACFKNPTTGNSYCVQQQWNHTASSSSAYDAGCTKNLQY